MFTVIIEHLNKNFIRITLYIAGFKNESLLDEVEGIVSQSLAALDVNIVRVVSRRIVHGRSRDNR